MNMYSVSLYLLCFDKLPGIATKKTSWECLNDKDHSGPQRTRAAPGALFLRCLEAAGSTEVPADAFWTKDV